MIDPMDGIKKLIVFFHETKVSSKQPPGHKFTSRGIIVTDHTFDFLNTLIHSRRVDFHPTIHSLFPEEITSIRDDPIDAAIDIDHSERDAPEQEDHDKRGNCS